MKIYMSSIPSSMLPVYFVYRVNIYLRLLHTEVKCSVWNFSLVAVGVEVEVISRHRSAPNQRAATIITVEAMVAMVIQAWGLMQGMAATMAVALKYDTSMFFTSSKFITSLL